MFVEPGVKKWFQVHALREADDDTEVCNFFKSPVMTPENEPCILTLGQVRKVHEGLKAHGNPARHFNDIKRWIDLTAGRKLAPFETVNRYVDAEREQDITLNVGQIRRLRNELNK